MTMNHHQLLRRGLGCFSLLLTFGLIGCGGGGGDDTADTGTKKTSKASTGDEEPATPAASTSPRASTGSGAPSGFPGAPGQDAAASAGPPRVATAKTPAFGARKDPFYVDWKQLPPPPNVFEEVQPIRVATTDVATPIERPVTIREVSPYRVSGVMTGDGIFAILEGVGQPEIVKPGSKLPNGYSVVAINEDSVRLEKKEGKITYVQTVPLSDGPSTGPAGGGGRSGYGPPRGAGPGGFAGGGFGPGRGKGGGAGPASAGD